MEHSPQVSHISRLFGFYAHGYDELSKRCSSKRRLRTRSTPRHWRQKTLGVPPSILKAPFSQNRDNQIARHSSECQLCAGEAGLWCLTRRCFWLRAVIPDIGDFGCDNEMMSRVFGNDQEPAGVTRQMMFARSSATISAPRGSTVTPTGRPRVLPSVPRKPVTKSTGGPAGRPSRKGTNTTL